MALNVSLVFFSARRCHVCYQGGGSIRWHVCHQDCGSLHTRVKTFFLPALRVTQVAHWPSGWRRFSCLCSLYKIGNLHSSSHDESAGRGEAKGRNCIEAMLGALWDCITNSFRSARAFFRLAGTPHRTLGCLSPTTSSQS